MTTETLIANSQNQKNNNNTSISSKQPYQIVPQHCQFPFYGNCVLIKTNAEVFSDKNKVDFSVEYGGSKNYPEPEPRFRSGSGYLKKEKRRFRSEFE